MIAGKTGQFLYVTSDYFLLCTNTRLYFQTSILQHCSHTLFGTVHQLYQPRSTFPLVSVDLSKVLGLQQAVFTREQENIHQKPAVSAHSTLNKKTTTSLICQSCDCGVQSASQPQYNRTIECKVCSFPATVITTSGRLPCTHDQSQQVTQGIRQQRAMSFVLQLSTRDKSRFDS